MTVAELLASAGFITAVISTIGWIYSYGRLSLKVDTMWEFTLRRGKSEAVDKGFATMNSPFIVTEEAKRRMEPLMTDIRETYRKLGEYVSDVDLMVELEQHYGDRMLTEVCIPCGFYMGACLAIAVQLLRDGDDAKKQGGGNWRPPTVARHS